MVWASAGDTDPWWGKWVAADGTKSDTAVWRTKAQWEAGITISDLTNFMDYRLRTWSRNGDGVQSDYPTVGTEFQTGTPTETPGKMRGFKIIGGVFQ
jgi:hypothetical protein